MRKKSVNCFIISKIKFKKKKTVPFTFLEFGLFLDVFLPGSGRSKVNFKPELKSGFKNEEQMDINGY